MAPRKIEHFSCQQPKFNDTLEASNENDLNFEDTELADQSGSSKARKWIHKTCTTKLLKSRLPCLQWIPEYTLRKSFHDFIAGLTVALTAIPQGIAYGAVAGLPVEFGLYTAFAGPFVYALFGSVRQVTVGPTAVMAIMTHEYTMKGGAPYAIVLSFLAGCIELLAGLFNLGWMMDFISGPVISGFCSAAAIITITSQIKTLLGLTFRGSSFSKVMPGIFEHWREIRPFDTLLGLACVLLLLFLKNLALMKKKLCCKGRHNLSLGKTIWFVSTCRNALVVLLGCVIAYAFELYDYHPFSLTGEIKSGIPSFQVPPFSFDRPIISSSSNRTNFDSVMNQNGTESVTFLAILADLGTGLAMIPIIAILEQVAIAKAFANGGKTDSTQEMIAVGLGSLFCSFFGCMPLTASFSRSSVLSASGGKTQFANFFNGCVILIALNFLMPTFYYIPKSVLAAVIIVAVYCMIEFDQILPLWRGRRIELLPFVATFSCCLLINIEYGILIGTQIHLLLLAYEGTRTKSTCIRQKKDSEGAERIIVRADRSLYFPAVELFRNVLSKAAEESKSNQSAQAIVIDMSRVSQVDHSSLKMLKSMLSTWDKQEVPYSFVNVSAEVMRTFQSFLPSGTNLSKCAKVSFPSLLIGEQLLNDEERPDRLNEEGEACSSALLSVHDTDIDHTDQNFHIAKE